MRPRAVLLTVTAALGLALWGAALAARAVLRAADPSLAMRERAARAELRAAGLTTVDTLEVSR